jgi:hypothetical protein
VAEAGDGRLALHSDGSELSVDHLAVDNHRFEVSQLVLQLTLLVLAAEEVDTFLNRVTLKEQIKDS